MKITAVLSSLVLFAASALVSANTVTVSFDQAYDVGSASLDTVACSDGANGLITKGFTTFASLPMFPHIGGAAAIAGFNSPNCGTCWALTLGSITVDVLAIDHAGAGFNIALEAMNELTNGQAEFLGRVNATAVQISAAACGLLK